MKVIERDTLRILEADEGKHIRLISDVYVPEHIDEETGEVVPEHFPYYSTTIYLAKNFNIEEIDDYYIEEVI